MPIGAIQPAMLVVMILPEGEHLFICQGKLLHMHASC